VKRIKDAKRNETGNLLGGETSPNSDMTRRRTMREDRGLVLKLFRRKRNIIKL